MILVLRQSENTGVFLTLDGRTYESNLYLRHDATRNEYVIELGDNVTQHPERYDHFIVDTSEFNDLPDGYYKYEIKEAVTGLIIESGKLFIMPSKVTFNSAPDDTTDDILIVN